MYSDTLPAAMSFVSPFLYRQPLPKAPAVLVPSSDVSEEEMEFPKAKAKAKKRSDFTPSQVLALLKLYQHSKGIPAHWNREVRPFVCHPPPIPF